MHCNLKKDSVQVFKSYNCGVIMRSNGRCVGYKILSVCVFAVLYLEIFGLF